MAYIATPAYGPSIELASMAAPLIPAALAPTFDNLLTNLSSVTVLATFLIV